MAAPDCGLQGRREGDGRAAVAGFQGAVKASKARALPWTRRAGARLRVTGPTAPDPFRLCDLRNGNILASSKRPAGALVEKLLALGHLEISAAAHTAIDGPDQSHYERLIYEVVVATAYHTREREGALIIGDNARVGKRHRKFHYPLP